MKTTTARCFPRFNEPQSRFFYVVVVFWLTGSLFLFAGCTAEQQTAITQSLDLVIAAAEIYNATQEKAEATVAKTQQIPATETERQPIYDNIKNAVQPRNPDVRLWALACAKESPGRYHLSQAEIIKAVTQTAWAYVSDPRGFEYFTPASESVRSLAGDCDDFAILLASLIESIGGRTRIVIADGIEGDHAYVEVWIGSTEEQAQEQLKTLKRAEQYKDQQYLYRSDSLGYWANFDWFSIFSGGPYFVAEREFYIYVD